MYFKNRIAKLRERIRQKSNELVVKLAIKVVGEGFDDLHDRVPIYSYPRRFRILFGSCLVLGTLGICAVRVWLEFALGLAFSWNQLAATTLDLLPGSGISSVIVGVILVEGATVLAEIVRNRELEEKNQKLEEQNRELQSEMRSEATRADAEAIRADNAEAKVAELQKKLDAKNGASDQNNGQ